MDRRIGFRTVLLDRPGIDARSPASQLSKYALVAIPLYGGQILDPMTCTASMHRASGCLVVSLRIASSGGSLEGQGGPDSCVPGPWVWGLDTERLGIDPMLPGQQTRR